MKKLWMSGLALTLTLAACDQKKNVDLKSDEQKISYAFGQQLGQGAKMQGIEIDVNAVTAGVNDAQDGKEARVKPEEMQQARERLMQNSMKKMKEDGDKNKETGKKFLEENAKKEGVKTTKSGLQYKVVTEGKGKSPKAESMVKIHYKGTLIDGTEFDSSYSRNEPAEFPLNGVIAGWTEGLQLMKVGSKYQFFIPSELAYGENGRPKIPGNSVLIFDVELLDILKDKK